MIIGLLVPNFIPNSRRISGACEKEIECELQLSNTREKDFKIGVYIFESHFCCILSIKYFSVGTTSCYQSHHPSLFCGTSQ